MSRMSSVADQLEQARQQELLDLTLRNPLLNYRTLKTRGVEIIDERAPDVFRLLVNEGRRMSFGSVTEEQKAQLRTQQEDALGALFAQPEEPVAAESDAADDAASDGAAPRHTDTTLQTPYTSPQLQKRLLNTFYHARRSIEETGVNTLYLALGMLHWYESPSSETQRRAPLLLIPVALDRTSVRGRFRVEDLGDDLGGNITLRAYLRQNAGIEWPLPDDPTAHLDVASYLDAAASAIGEHERWYIDRTAMALGFFSFTRFLMYEDLDVTNWPEANRPDQHPILRKVLDEGFSSPPDRVDDNTFLDPLLEDEETFHVVEADSSQTRALLDVRRGHNLVLQGPPGTGKSQTITNIIADAIGTGKTVLFVSEKMAALEVVKRNLDSVGLGDACLELHSHKTRKQEVLRELERTLYLGEPKGDDFEQEALHLQRTRNRLNAYADAVNTPIGDSGVRPYRAYGELERLREALDGIQRPPLEEPDMAAWDRSTFTDRQIQVQQMEAHLSDMGVPSMHPFWGSRRTSFLPTDVQALETTLTDALKALHTLSDAAETLADTVGLPAPSDADAIDTVDRAAAHLLHAPDLTGVDPHAEVWRVQAEAVRDLVDAGTRYASLRAEYDDLLIPEAWTQDVLQTRQHLAAHDRKWYRWIFGTWRAANATLAGLCQAEPPSDPDERLALLDAIREAQRLRTTLAEAPEALQTAFGSRWNGPRSDWDALASIATFLLKVHADCHNGTLPDAFLDTLVDPPPNDRLHRHREALQTAWPAYQEALAHVTETLDFDPTRRFDDNRPLLRQPLAVQADVLQACADAPAGIQKMATFNGLAQDLDEAGLAAVRRVAATWTHGPSHLVDWFEHAYFTALIARAMDERPALRRFSGAQHDETVAAFRRLDTKALEHNRVRLAQMHYDRLPARSGVGQMGVLMNEFGKKTRHMPLRTLMEQAGRPIQAIKPVFMMSPMSVPKYLPPNSVSFDLVVFDEASQVHPVDAFGAIVRGAQTVVVGDNKQLPPTSFFDASDDAERDGYEPRAGDQESILDLFLSRGAPERMLRFHYRSKHESLIAVSNKEFYDNNLFVFPSPDAEQHDLGLRYHHLPDAAYDRGGSRANKEEARVVAERVMKHARTRPDLSLGVATFSSAQQDAVRDQLEILRRQDPSCEDFFNGHPTEPFFIKNLESVQGDQRDVMFISVGYGRDANGKLTMNFGPLNRDGGERRLNVLITRAKYRCEVFTNLRADDIDLHRTNARGVRVLKEYLHFAETGTLDRATPTGGDVDSPFEAAVARALRHEGYRVEHQIGQAGFSIDLAVVDPERPGRYLLGIECDGATYHSSRMARDRDRARQAVLESLGWTIHRIWSTDWFRNPREQTERTVAAIEKARRKAQALDRANAGPDAGPDADPEEGTAAPTPKGTPASTATAPTEMPTTIERTETPPDDPAEADLATPYVAATLDIDVNRPLRDVPVKHMATWVRQIVETEHPVHTDVVARRIVAASDVSRLGKRIRQRIQKGIAYAARQEWIAHTNDILLDPSADGIPIRDRSGAGDGVRDIRRVPPQEIAAAAEQITQTAFGIAPDALIPQVARTLGFQRTGSTIEATIRAVLDDLQVRGRLLQDDGQWVVPAE